MTQLTCNIAGKTKSQEKYITMTQDQLRQEIMRMAHENTIAEKLAQLDIFSNCLMNLVLSNDEAKDHMEVDAKIILQMILSKVLHIRDAFKGMTYISPEDIILLNGLLDPTIIGVLSRNLFETICAFHLIYINTKSAEERRILHNLWVISGLKYRQKFTEIITTEENKEKAENELREIDRLTEEVKNTEVFQAQGTKGKSKIITRINQKDYKIIFKGTEVHYLSWQDVTELLLNQNPLFKEMYTYFSLYAHPSYISVLQYSQMFNAETEGNKSMAMFNLRFCLILVSIFLSDYLKLFPVALPVFENFSDVDQIKMNMYNRMIRGNAYSINNSWELLG
jgi:hypothetical protein